MNEKPIINNDQQLIKPINLEMNSILEPLKPLKWNLYYSAISANLLYISLGCTLAWPSSAIPKLQKMGMTQSEETWIVSLLMLGSCLGPSIYSITIDRLGRKYSLLLTGTIYLLSWLILGLGGNNIYALCIGRFIGGVAVGSSLNCVPVYISEISDAEIRQTLTSMSELFVSIGSFIQYAAGPWLTYGNLIIVSALPGLMFGLATARVRETPYHLVARGRTQQAFEALVWFRGPNQAVSQELSEIELSVKESVTHMARRKDLILMKGPRKAFLLSSLLFLVQPFTAIDIIAAYLYPILSSTSLPISTNMATILVGALSILFGACEPLVVHRFGSKWTLVTCSFFCAFFLLCFGVYKYFDERHYNLSSVSVLPIVCIVLYQMSFLIGYGALPWSIAAELFPISLQGFAINVTTTMSWIIAFAVMMTFGDVSPIVGVSSCFIFFSCVLVVGTILTAIFVPNTKGQTLNTIRDNLHRS